MNKLKNAIRLTAITAAIGFSTSAWAATAAAYAPTSVEILYQPTYSMATGGPTARLGSLGAGIRIGYGMTSNITVELGGYYNGYVFGDIVGSDLTAYAARGTADIAFAPSPNVRFYAGIDANAYFSPPTGLTLTGNKDLGGFTGVRFLVGKGPRFFVGTEYRYAVNTVFTYSGGSINPSAVVGSVGIHFGGL